MSSIDSESLKVLRPFFLIKIMVLGRGGTGVLGVQLKVDQRARNLDFSMNSDGFGDSQGTSRNLRALPPQPKTMIFVRKYRMTFKLSESVELMP